MPTTDHSDHLTGPQSAAPVLSIAELFAADLLPPRAPQSRSLARTAQRRQRSVATVNTVRSGLVCRVLVPFLAADAVLWPWCFQPGAC